MSSDYSADLAAARDWGKSVGRVQRYNGGDIDGDDLAADTGLIRGELTAFREGLEEGYSNIKTRELKQVNRHALTKLPWVCAHRLPASGEVILIIRGEDGYIPAGGHVFNADRFNQVLGINAYQAEAMQTGSMFGWGTPGCDPDSYREKGLTIVPGSFTELERLEQSNK